MTIRITSFILVFLTLSMAACGNRKCQAPANERFITVVDQPWRLVETTDTSENFRTLSNTTFLVFDFTKDYKGSVKKVENNAEYQNPVLVFQYNIDPNSQKIRAQFTEPPSEEEGAAASTQSANKGTIVDYNYELGRELELYSQSGYYRFVPYNGIVTPDDTCKF